MNTTRLCSRILRTGSIRNSSGSRPCHFQRDAVKVCVIGSGPAGFYTAHKLLKVRLTFTIRGSRTLLLWLAALLELSCSSLCRCEPQLILVAIRPSVSIGAMHVYGRLDPVASTVEPLHGPRVHRLSSMAGTSWKLSWHLSCLGLENWETWKSTKML